MPHAAPSIAYLGLHGFWRALDLVLPPRCAGCGAPAARWCSVCAASVRRLSAPLCSRCGLPLPRQPAHPGCPECTAHPPAWTALRSWAVYEGALREAVHALKYRRDLGVGDALAPILAAETRAHGWPVDLVAPVPLSRARLRERGYNQAAILAFPLALANGWRYSSRALLRVRDTASQVHLDGVARRLNLSGALVADPRRVAGKTVLVVDDVTTTGATMQACAEALFQAGAAAVYGQTLARAGRFPVE